MTELKVIARLRVHDGKLEEFKTIAQACLDSVQTKDKGTLQYDWFFNANHTECVVFEKYPESAALLEHVANLGETLGQLLAVSDMSLEIYGAPSEELMTATEGLGVAVYSFFQGK